MNYMNRFREKKMSLVIRFLSNYNQYTKNSRTLMVYTIVNLRKFEKETLKNTPEDVQI